MDYDPDNNNNDEDDVLRFLPPLKKESSTSKTEESDGESGWFASFIGEVADDVAPEVIHSLVVDYLICEGYQEAAELLCADAEIKFPREGGSTPNVESLERRNSIRNAIINGDLDAAVAMIEELAPSILADNKKLHFKLLRQQLVELIRAKNIDRVLEFGQQHLLDKCDQSPDLLNKLEQTYALIAFETPETSPFGYLLSLQQRNLLATEVNAAVLGALNKSPTSKLEQLFRLMVWNQYQLTTKGESTRPLGAESAGQIAKELFGNSTEEDPSSDML